MIPKVTKGDRVRGLLEYLYGPGRFEEHTNPHLVAGYDDPAVLEPPRDEVGRVDLAGLTARLDAPQLAAGERRLRQYVWQCSLSLPADEAARMDAQWRAIAEWFIAGMGFAGEGERAGCRWVAVHYGLSKNSNDHVHVAAGRARGAVRRDRRDARCLVLRAPGVLPALGHVPDLWPVSAVGAAPRLASGDGHGRARGVLRLPDRAALLKRVRYRDGVEELTVRMVTGQIPKDHAKASERLAHTFGVNAAKVLPGRLPDLVVLVLMHGDPLAATVDPLPVPLVPDFTALPLGKREDGRGYCLRLFGTQVLIVGATGAGKGSGIWSLLSGSGPARCVVWAAAR